MTRGGTNEFHGSAFYFGRRDALNATNYFLEQADQPKDELKRNDFGWTLGGPIIKDKLHFFASQEWNREKRGTVRTALVPTAAERVGDFSQPVFNAGGSQCSPPIPIDPLTGEAFPGNRIPADRLSPAGLALPAALSAAQHHPGRGQLQQLGDLAQLADQLAAGEHPPGLDAQQHRPPDGALHAGQLDERLAERQHEPLGRRSVPRRRLELGPAEPLAHGPAHPQHRLEGRQHAELLVLGQQDRGHAWRRDPEPERSDPRRDALDLPPQLQAVRQRDGPPRVLGRRRATRPSGTRRPSSTTRTCSSSRTTTRRSSASTSSRPASSPAPTRRTRTPTATAPRRTRRSGAPAGLDGWNANTGNILSDFLLKDMTFGFSESSGFRAGPDEVARPRVLRLRLVEGRPRA